MKSNRYNIINLSDREKEGPAWPFRFLVTNVAIFSENGSKHSSEQARRDEIHIGGASANKKQAKREKMGVRGLAPGRIFHDHAL